MGFPPPRPRSRPLWAFARRRPFLCLFGLIVLSNLAGSIFNGAYNQQLIVTRHLNEAQRAAFWQVALPVYNVVAYPVCLGLVLYLLAPLHSCLLALRQGVVVPPALLDRCRRRLVNLPFHIVYLNFLGWIPGAAVFPAVICGLGGSDQAAAIWIQFLVSFTVSALLTTAQTFFLVETYLSAILYPDFFADARPAEVRGAVHISFGLRLLLLWSAVAVMPVVALLAVALNPSRPDDVAALHGLALAVAAVGAVSGGLIFWMVGRNLLRWVHAHAAATARVAQGDFAARLDEKRPDEWGQLTDRFNDMAAALGQARHLRETFGQFLSPEVRDEVVQHHPGLGGEVREVTILFADIRGFTRRSAGADPAQVVGLLNEFLTLAVTAVETTGGWVNKFLGDGVLALFGAPRPRQDHADLAVAAALKLCARLGDLNAVLARQGQAPLVVGIGIHTGPALVGCVGASVPLAGGGSRVRREYTAIGDTVNLCQRLEQLTKRCGGPVLLSAATHARLRRPVALEDLGPQELAGCEETLVVYRVRTG